ncbi:MAG: sigma-70 family RNA polymerase sigma factor [Gemmataceae bacterium]
MRNHRPGRQSYVVAAVLLGTMAALSQPGMARADLSGADRAVADLSRYCSACWRNARVHPDRWTDCTQQVFARLLERVPPQNWDRSLHGDGLERREFLRAIDAVKKRTRRERWLANLPEAGVADRHHPNERRLAEDREAVRDAAAEVLSNRQQQILQLSFEGWSVRDIASNLELPEARVSDEKYKAIRKLRAHFVGRDE